MGLFDKLHHSEQEVEVVAFCTGKYVKCSDLKDQAFASEALGQTVAIEPSENEIVSPVSGTIEVFYPTKHAFAVRSKDGTGYLVHVGIDTVNLNGDGFDALKSQGQKVKAGEPVLKVDLAKIREKYCATTMLIITEPVKNKKYDFIGFDEVTKGEIITKQLI